MTKEEIIQAIELFDQKLSEYNKGVTEVWKTLNELLNASQPNLGRISDLVDKINDSGYLAECACGHVAILEKRIIEDSPHFHVTDGRNEPCPINYSIRHVEYKVKCPLCSMCTPWCDTLLEAIDTWSKLCNALKE